MLRDDPHPFYERLRAKGSVYLDSQLGCWIVSSYKDVTAALKNHALSSERFVSPNTFSSSRWHRIAHLSRHIAELMFFADLPRHTRLRHPFSVAFGAAGLESWSPRIQTLVDQRVDAARARGQMDVVRDLALPLPIQVMAEMMGAPSGDEDRLKEWSDDLAQFLGNAPTLEICTRMLESLSTFKDYFRPILAERSADSNAPIDAIVRTNNQCHDASEDELLVNCAGLFAGGHETTTNLIGNGILALLRHPHELQKLQRDPTLIVGAVEECLRYDSPVQFTARKAKEETEIGGKRIHKGQSVLLMLGAANRDPGQFKNPDVFDITRKDNRHLAFGYNTHYCVGAALGRLEGQIAIGTMVRRAPDLQLEPQSLEWRDNLSFRGVKSLKVRVSRNASVC